MKLLSGDPKKMNKASAFCRCGASGNEPFCDGSHKKIDFKGKTQMRKVLVLFAHPKFEHSEANQALISAISDLEQVEVRDLYELVSGV